MRISALFAAAALVPMSVGCLQQVDYVEPENIGFFDTDSNYRDISPNIRDGVLSGRFGPNDQPFNNDAATSVSGYTDDYGSSNVTVITERNGRMGMLIVDTYDASLLTLPAGTYSTRTDQPQVGVMVCANDFDAPANDADVVIVDQPDGTRTITVEAIVDEEANYGMDNSDDPAIGEFTLVR